MAKPHILVLAGEDAELALVAAGFMLAGNDAVRRQTAAIVIDTRGEAGKKAGELARSIKAALGPRAGLMMAWSDGQSDYEKHLFDGALDCFAKPQALAARLSSSLRIAVMADEARMRFKSLAHYGGASNPPIISPTKATRVLIFGPPGPELMSMSAALEEMGAQSVAAFTSFTAFDYLHTGDFDAVIVIAHDDRGGALSFAGALRRNARLFHMPCLILGSHDFREPEEAMERGASDFAIAGDDDGATALRLLDLVDEKRSRDALTLAFSAARAPKAMDVGTGLYSFDFFKSHLNSLTARALETDRPLSIALARIAPSLRLAELGKGRGLDRIVGQAGSMLSRLVRTEDIAARLDRTTFAVAFPASDEDAARIAAERISAVLECTAFDVGPNEAGYSNDEAVQLTMLVTSVGYIQGESAQSLMERSLASLPVVDI